MRMDAILVLNAGSSSLKFQVFALGPTGLERQIKGQIEGIGVLPRFRAADAAGATLIDERPEVRAIPDLPHATRTLKTWLRGLSGYSLQAVGHRVVHGGPEYAAPVRIDEVVMKRLQAYEALAPLHQPSNLASIRLVRELSPDLTQVACFDTAFHRSHPAVADFYAIPWALHEEGVRRYGFHGLSYEYVSQRLREVAPDIAAGRVIVAHLGSGASMCALKDAQSMDSTMGFTALDGLPMGTRPGQIDPGVVLYLIDQKGMSAAEVSSLLYKDSGMKGLSGISNDMRDLLASDDPRAAFAIDYFVQRCAVNIGGLAAAMDGVDALVFTAGIGENAPEIRARIAARLGWLGADLDEEANAASALVISAPGSSLRLMVVPTDEELMIARQTLALLPPRG